MQKRQNKHPDPTPWLFLAPSLCGVTLFVLAPFVETVRRSVTDTMGRHFVGLANYTAVLGNDAFRLAGGKYGAVYRSMRSAAAGAQSGTGFGATGERLKKYLLGRGLPHNLFAAHGFAGGKPCTALESIVCPKRPCERNFWHPL